MAGENIKWISPVKAKCWSCGKNKEVVAHDRSIPNGHLCQECFGTAVFIDRLLDGLGFEHPSQGSTCSDDRGH